MKVRELVKDLLELDQDFDVIIAKDTEGNGYSPMSSPITTGRYTPETTWAGEFEDSDTAMSINAICLWPTN